MLIVKGFIIGIGKIIPGVSGSLIAISLGIYENAINAFVNLFNNFKTNIFYLGQLSLGIVLAVICCSNLILYCLNNYYLYTMLLFIGLMIGNIPSSLKEIKETKKINYVYLIISFLLVYIIYKFKFPTPFIPRDTLCDYSIVFLLGFLDAFTMIIPGISGTALFMMLNCYYFIINLFSNLFFKLHFTIIFGIGVLVGIIFTTYVVNLLFKKYKHIMYLIILGFTITSLLILIEPLIIHISINNIFPSILFIICGIILSKKMENIS